MWVGTEHHPYGCVFCVRCEGGCTGSTEHREDTNVGVFSVFDVRGEAKGVPNMKNMPHGPVFCVWRVEEGRGGEGRHVGVSGIPSGWGRLEGGAR